MTREQLERIVAAERGAEYARRGARGSGLIEQTLRREHLRIVQHCDMIEALCDNGRRSPNPIAIRAIQGWIAESERIIESTEECLRATRR